MSSANRQHLVPSFLPRRTDSITVCIASAVDLPAVKPYRIVVVKFVRWTLGES